MKLLEFEESDMNFGPFSENECFRIEHSSLYKSVNRGSKKEEGVKIAEFILLRKGRDQESALWVVEAKSSSPRPETRPGFDGFISEISEKLVNAFSLCYAACLKRHPDTFTEFPLSFRSLDVEKTNVRFILIIKGHEDSWLPPLQEALSKALRVTVIIWAFTPDSVAVINDDIARKYGLISANQVGSSGE
jgi:hypothetical protein